MSLDALFDAELARLLPELQRIAEAYVAGAAGARAALGRLALDLRGAASVVDLPELTRFAQQLANLPEAPAGNVGLATALNREFERVRMLLGATAGERARQVSGLGSVLAATLAGGSEGQAAPAPSTPRPAASDRLASLFRQEAETQLARIAGLLVQLEQEPERLDLLAPLMRAVHSLKGAARAVQLDPAVKLAHAFEERLTEVQRGSIVVDEPLVDLFLKVTDQLRALAIQGDDPALTEAQARLLARLAGQEDVARAEPPAPSLPPQPSYLAAEEADPVLRVRASHVSRLIALAGTGLIESTRLKVFVERQLRLRQQLAAMARLVDAIPGAASPGGTGAPGELRRLLHDARRSAASLVEDFSEYARTAADLSERSFAAASATRMRPLRDLVAGYPRMLRDLARGLHKKVRFAVEGEAVLVDRDVLERLDVPLTHLLRNAVDHGIETPRRRRAAGKPEEGSIHLWASYRTGMLSLELSDDGAGVDRDRVRKRLVDEGQGAEQVRLLDDAQLLETLFRAGFSTAEQVSEVSGRGVGLDAVRDMVQQIGGSIRLSSAPGRGTSFQMLLPISRAITRAMVVRVAGELYAFPLLRIERVLKRPLADLRQAEGRDFLPFENRNLALCPLAELLELGMTQASGDLSIVVCEQEGVGIGFVVDALHGEFDLATRPLDPRLGRIRDLQAAALLPDGSPVLLLDVDDLMRNARRQGQPTALLAVPAGEARESPLVLVVDDSISVRELERQVLEGAGYRVRIAVDGVDAWTKLQEPGIALVVTDVDMPRMDGIELTRSIKQDSRLKRLPVVMVSYRDRPEDRTRGLAARADRYLTKSDFQDQHFLEVVADLIGDAVRPGSQP